MSLRRRAARLATLTVLAVAAAACSGDYDRVTTTPPPTTTPKGATTTTTLGATTTTRPAPPVATTTTVPGPPTTTIPGSAAGLPGRLAVLALDGSLLTTKPDGTDPRGLAVGSPGTSVANPTWSPDATRLVWTALGTNAVRVRSATVDGTDVRDAALSPSAYAFLFNRAGTDLVALREMSTTSVELTRLAPATLAATPVRTAPSLATAWSPDGTRLAVRAGADQLLIVDPTGAARALPATPGVFGAPQWLDDKTVLVAVRAASTQYLAFVDVDTGARRDLLSFTGGIRFLLDPKRERIAYLVLPETGGGSGANVSFRPQTTTPPTTPPAAPTTTVVPTATTGQLGVLEVATRRLTTVTTTQTTMFQWSPTAERLAYLTAEPNSAFRWHFWSTNGTVDGPVYAPTISFLRVYSRAFDQTAAAVQWWSPNGAAFVFSGRVGNRSGVFVQQMTGAAALLVTDGDTAVWSPR